MRGWGICFAVAALIPWQCAAGADAHDRFPGVVRADTPGAITLADHGTSKIAGTWAGARVVVELTQRQLPWAAPSADDDERWRTSRDPHGAMSECTLTYSPCLLMQHLSIHVAGANVDVPPEVLREMADLAFVVLRPDGHDAYRLLASGGDGADSYTVALTFDRHRVRRLDRFDGESGGVDLHMIWTPDY